MILLKIDVSKIDNTGCSENCAIKCYNELIKCESRHLEALKEWIKAFPMVEIEDEFTGGGHGCIIYISCAELLETAEEIYLERDCCLETLTRVQKLTDWSQSKTIGSIEEALTDWMQFRYEGEDWDTFWEESGATFTSAPTPLWLKTYNCNLSSLC